MARSGYVARIREKIGNDLLMLIGVSVFVFDPAERVLLAQQRDSNLWVPIGGGLEPGESPADAGVREFWEETGARVELTRVLGVFGGSDYRIIYRNGDAVSYTTIAFEGKIASGTPKPDGKEIATLAWIAPSEFEGLSMLPGMFDLLRNSVAHCSEPYFKASDWSPPNASHGV
jgi:8-oxo-dGTP pyrophosphatase MutT (NUDIX family)